MHLSGDAGSGGGGGTLGPLVGGREDGRCDDRPSSAGDVDRARRDPRLRDLPRPATEPHLEPAGYGRGLGRRACAPDGLLGAPSG
eukprot:3581428-Prymnesium_polylepis.1